MLSAGLAVSVCMCFLLSNVHSLRHCGKTDIPDGVLRENVVNVVYTMDTSCGICVQQASRLPQLKRYLEKKGIKTHLIIGSSQASGRIPGVRHIQVNNRQIWRALGAQNNHFYVIDRCGRLVFEIINPFSNLNLPFVRSAVVATQFTHRCGLCPVDYSTEAKREEVTEYPELSPSQEYIPDDIMPLKMILRKPHTHKGDSRIYKYIVSIAELPNYHSHLPNDGELPRREVPIRNNPETTTGRNGEREEETTTSVPVEERHAKAGSQPYYFSPTTRRSIEANTETAIAITPAQDHSKSSGILGPTSERTHSITQTNKPVDEQTTTLGNLGIQGIAGKEKSPNSISGDRKGDAQSEVMFPTTVASVLLSPSKESINEENPNKKGRHKEVQEESDQVPPDKTVKNRRLTPDELAQKQALLDHYKHILDWISFSNDYEAID